MRGAVYIWVTEVDAHICKAEGDEWILSPIATDEQEAKTLICNALGRVFVA